MWYSNQYRRHLCDMHIEDWDPAFLSRFSPEDYVQNLKTAKVQSAMIYFQSHVGYSYYPTKTGHMHRVLEGKEDTMLRLVDLCHKSGINVIGYYSLIYNNWAHNTHPSWRMVTQKGISEYEENASNQLSFAENSGYRYGLCCPNNQDYRAFVQKQIKEMLDYFPVEGMFFDMLYWPHMCYCPTCQKRWADEVGGALPEKEDWHDPKWLLQMQKRREWMGEFAQFVTDIVKSLRPEVSVAHNLASAIGPDGRLCCSELVNNACDYSGGDLYGGLWDQSFTCKFYRSFTRNQPYEYMFSRCDPNLSKHTITKSKKRIQSSVFLTCAHHGATLVIDAIDPVGTLDSRVYRTIGQVFEQEKAYEPYLLGSAIEDAGIYYSLNSKFFTDGNPYHNHDCSVNLARTLAEYNLCSGVTGVFGDLSKFPLLIASYLTQEDARDNQRILDYVKKGGCLYVSGGNNTSLIEALLDAKVAGDTKENRVYFAPSGEEELPGGFNKEYPLPFDGTAAIIEGVPEEEVLATITLPYTVPGTQKFASIHSNPPGIPTKIPAIVSRKYGNGRVIWSAAPIEGILSRAYQNVFMWLIGQLLPQSDRTLLSDAPSWIELVAFQDDSCLLVSSVCMLELDDPIPQPSFTIRIKCSVPPTSVLLLPRCEPVDFSYQDGYVIWKSIENLDFQMYQIRID